METQSIVVLDFGAQYSQLIARRIREQNVFSVVLPCTATLEEIRSYSPVGIILSGGPSSVYDADAPPADTGVLQLGLPVLGICYGLQFMVHTLGGKVRAADKREYGHANVEIQNGCRLFEGLPCKTFRLDVAWGRSGRTARRIPPRRQFSECGGRNRSAGEKNVGGAIPSRSASYPVGRRHFAQLCAQHLWRKAYLDCAALH